MLKLMMPSRTEPPVAELLRGRLSRFRQPLGEGRRVQSGDKSLRDALDVGIGGYETVSTRVHIFASSETIEPDDSCAHRHGLERHQPKALRRGQAHQVATRSKPGKKVGMCKELVANDLFQIDAGCATRNRVAQPLEDHRPVSRMSLQMNQHGSG